MKLGSIAGWLPTQTARQIAPRGAVPSGFTPEDDGSVELSSPTPSPLSVPGKSYLPSQRAESGAAVASLGGSLGLTLQHLILEAQRSQVEDKSVYSQNLKATTHLQQQSSGVAELPQGIPTLVLPDLHGRRDFLLKALSRELQGGRAFELLKAGRLNVVCLGDGMHAEGRAQGRWQMAEAARLQGHSNSAAMEAEMLENLSTMKMVMLLKQAFPSNFHYIRGNHDEVLGSYKKYADKVPESQLVRDWMETRFGRDFVGQWSAFEESMPLATRGENFVTTHAAPGQSLSRQQIKERNPRAFKVLAWTDNRQWGENDAARRRQFAGNLAEMGIPNGHWVVGHRQVEEGLFRSQMGGQLVQINDPRQEVVALIPSGTAFNPKRDVFRL